MQTPSTRISSPDASPSAMNGVLPNAAVNSTRISTKRVSTLVVLAVLRATGVAVAMTRDSASAAGKNHVQHRDAAPTSAQASVAAAPRAPAGTAGGVPFSAFRWR